MAPPFPGIEAIQSSFATNSDWAEYSAILLIVGLLGEVIVALVFRENRSRREIGWAVFLAGIVTLGVIGEVIFGRRAATASNELKRFSDERIATLNLETETLRADNLELQRLMHPRFMGIVPNAKSYERLKRFAGTPLLIESAPDFEAMQVAEQVRLMVESVGWKPAYVDRSKDRREPITIMDGIEINCLKPLTDEAADRFGTIDPLKIEPLPDDPRYRAWAAGEALTKYFNLLGLEPRFWPDLSPGPAPARLDEFGQTPDTIIVRVGVKPIPRDWMLRGTWRAAIPWGPDE